MSDIRLIALDLDGTLLTDNKELPPGFFRTVEKLEARGVRVVIASGRQYFNLAKLFAPFRDKLLFMCDNGALVFDGADNVFSCPLPRELLDAPYRAAKKIPTAAPLLCGAKSAYLGPHSDVVEDNVKLYYEKRSVVADPLTAACNDLIVKIAVFDSEDAATNCLPRLKVFGDQLKLTLAGKQWLDCMRSDVNKGAGIAFLQHRLGLTPEHCMAFGDYLNDSELLNCVHYSYAMANGHPDLIAAAKFTAPSNAEYGVMRVIAEYFPDCVD